MKKTRVLYLGNQLSKHGFTPTSVETLGERLGAEVHITQASSHKNQILRLIHMWWMVVICRNYDYLLIDTYSSSAFTYAWTSARIAQFFKLKYIPILHGGDLPNRAKKSPDLIKYYVKNAHVVVSPSGYLKEAMEQQAEGSYLIIPNFIDIENYPYQVKKVDEHSIKLFWLRSFHKTYNPTLAIKVVKDLVNQGFGNVELCMVGPNKDGTMDEVKQLAEELGVDKNLKITGKLSKPEWISLSKDYNVFINTTNFDNTPVSVIEALALGFPVISTNVGGIPWLLEDGKSGILVEPDNKDAMVNSIKKLIQSPELALSMSKNAREKSETWDWNEVKLNWLEILK